MYFGKDDNRDKGHVRVGQIQNMFMSLMMSRRHEPHVFLRILAYLDH